MVSGGWRLRCKAKYRGLKYRKSSRVEGHLENEKKRVTVYRSNKQASGKYTQTLFGFILFYFIFCSVFYKES
jgi:hypothetical protein